MNLKDRMLSHEQYKTLCISTGDIPECDIEFFENIKSDMIMKRDTGFFIKLYEEPTYNVYDVTDDTLDILFYAHNAGFRMIEIDADAQSILEAL